MTALRRLSALAALAAVSALAVLSGCSVSASPGEDVDSSEDELRTSYDDLMSTLTGADLDRWFAVRQALVSGFDQMCGDTICSGDYSNLSTVRLVCSSTLATRKLKDCAWVLGGSIDRVDGRTGKITSEPRVFTCKIPVAGTATQMLDQLAPAGADAIRTAIPGTGKSFYDGLVACFDGVVGPPPPQGDATFYAELGDYFWEVGDQQGLAWSNTRRALVESFDQICGDTFCEGEYSDITGLRFACSVNRNTKRVSRCYWSFAAANTSVSSRGAIKAETTTKTCKVEIDATASDLAAALGTGDPLEATLPGKTTSIYEALIGCL